jgi:CRP-like cAMP-binding protein
LKEGEVARHVFCLVDGGVRIYHRAPGGEAGEIVVKLFRAPAFFGEMEVLLGLEWLETVETVLPSEVLRISGAAFDRLLKSDGRLSYALVQDLTLRLCIATEHARVLAFTSLESRLASLMVDHLNLFGTEDAETGGLLIDVKVSQDTLARSLAVSRKSVNATFRDWRARGLLTKREGRYVVLDRAALEGLAVESKYGLAYVLSGDAPEE